MSEMLHARAKRMAVLKNNESIGWCPECKEPTLMNPHREGCAKGDLARMKSMLDGLALTMERSQDATRKWARRELRRMDRADAWRRFWGIKGV